MRTDRLKQIRDQRQLSQQDLADRAEISLKQIWRIENGESDPTAEVLMRIARELDVSTDWLLGLVDQPTEHKREEDLTPMEMKLLQAYRKGLIVEALEVITAGAKRLNQTGVSTSEPAVDR